MERIELDLSVLEQNDSLRIIQEYKNRQIIYDVTVINPGEMPLCNISLRHDDGATFGPNTVILEGSGKWTTPRENPAQNGDPFFGSPHQESALSIYDGHIYTEGNLSILEPETRQRFLFEGKIKTIERNKATS